MVNLIDAFHISIDLQLLLVCDYMMSSRNPKLSQQILEKSLSKAKTDVDRNIVK